MTAMNKQTRDDIQYRLFPLLEAEYGVCVKHMTIIKPHVWIIDSDRGNWILKKYPSFFEASRQQMFIRLLKKAQFQAAPSIEGMVLFQSAYWTLQTYIPSSRTFTFADEEDRNAGILLLKEYHSCSPQLLHHPFLTTMIPRYPLYEKWKQRYQLFLYYLPAMKRIMVNEELSFMLQCAQYFFEQFPKFFHSFTLEENAVIHGDVASHNFLRTEQGTTYLIDYDLIAVAPPSIDYLQYANRILPHVQWSLAYLERWAAFQSLLAKPWFLVALLFPADFMRECRFLVRRNKPFSLPDFERRKQFVQKIIDVIR